MSRGRRWRRYVVMAIAVTAASVALAACGSDGGDPPADTNAKAEIRQVVEDYQDYFLARDGDAVCAQLAASGQREVVKFGRDTGLAGSGASCSEVVRVMSRGAKKIEQQRSKTLSVEVNGDEATAMVSDGGRPAQPSEFVKVDGAWKMRSAGLQNPLQGG